MRQAEHARRGFLSSLVAASLLPAAAGCGSSSPVESGAGEGQSARPAPQVETLTIERRGFTDTVQVTGTVRASRDVTIAAEVAGTVRDLVPLGTRVEQGELLAQLDPTRARAALAQARAVLTSAQARLTRARSAYERQRPLAEQQILAPVEFEQVVANREQAEAAVEQAEAQVSDAAERVEQTQIRAPFAGTVEQRFVEEWEQLQPGQNVVRLVDASRLAVRAGVAETYAGAVDLESPVRVSTGLGDRAMTEGELSFIGAAVDEGSRTFPIEVDLPTSAAAFKPGMVARLDIPVATYEGAAVVPRAAVMRGETGEAVFVVAADSADGEAARVGADFVARRQAVVTGPGNDNVVVIESGLSAGDEVVVFGLDELTEGESVEVVRRYDTAEAAATPLGPVYEDAHESR